MHRPNCHPVMHTVQPRGWCSGCRSSQTTRAPYWYMYVHTPRHPGGHSSGRPGPSHTWHHSCRTYFVMYICVLRDLTGTTRLCYHIVRMLLAALSGVTARTLGRRAEKRCEVAVAAPRRHGHTVHGTKLAAAKRHRQRAGLQDYSPVACWFEKIEIYPTHTLTQKTKKKAPALWTAPLRVPDFHTHAHQGSDSQAHSSDSSPYLRLSARSTMASWMKLATSRDIVACVLLLLLLRGCGVGRTKTSMCLGVATAHAGYLPGSQGAIAGRLRQAGPWVAREPCSGKAAKQRQGQRSNEGPRVPPAEYVRASGVPGLVRHRPDPASNTNACAAHAMHGPCRLVPRSVERKSSMSESTMLIPACGQASCMANTSVSAPGSLRYHTTTFSAGHSGWVSTHKSMHTYSVALRELGSVATRIGSAACGTASAST